MLPRGLGRAQATYRYRGPGGTEPPAAAPGRLCPQRWPRRPGHPRRVEAAALAGALGRGHGRGCNPAADRSLAGINGTKARSGDRPGRAGPGPLQRGGFGPRDGWNWGEKADPGVLTPSARSPARGCGWGVKVGCGELWRDLSAVWGALRRAMGSCAPQVYPEVRVPPWAHQRLARGGTHGCVWGCQSACAPQKRPGSHGGAETPCTRLRVGCPWACGGIAVCRALLPVLLCRLCLLGAVGLENRCSPARGSVRQAAACSPSLPLPFPPAPWPCLPDLPCPI